jgi:autoinducer 2-degrading protein
MTDAQWGEDMMAAGKAGGAHATGVDREEAFAITVAFELKEGMFRSFHRLVSDNAAMSVEREQGCLRFDVLTPLDDSVPHVLLYEIYVNRAAFALHLQSDHYLDFDQSSRDMVRQKIVANFKVSENSKEQ